MIILVLLICGLAVGVMSSFFGVGGGALMVPILYTVFPDFSNTMVIATSLGTIFLLTSINSYAFWRDRYYPEISIIVLVIIATIIGGYTGSLFSYKVETELSKKVLAVILIMAIIKNYAFKPQLNNKNKIQNWKLFLTGVLGAFLSSITGLGGGVIFVPMLMSFVLVPSKQISPYSNLMMMSATLMGVMPHLFKPIDQINNLPSQISSYFLGQMNFGIVLIFLTTGFIGAKIGRGLYYKVSEDKKKLFFSLLLLALSIKLSVF